MKTVEDLDVNRAIRQVLTKHWIDLGCVNIRSANGRVTLRGFLDRLYGFHDPLTPAIVERIFHDIRRVSGVRTVAAHLENWGNHGGCWRQLPCEGRHGDKRWRLKLAGRLAGPSVGAGA